MRPTTWIIGLGSASIALSLLCGCSWKEIFPPNVPTLPNAVAVDRALRLCSLSESDQPFHLVLDVSPPSHAPARARSEEMQAQIELFWLNAITYRTVIRSRNFSQTRIVNGSIIEEHNTGDFYPRWIQNFVETLLNPIPKASVLRSVPGTIPVGVQAHACISTQADSEPGETANAQVCFQDAEPRIASTGDFTRSVWFDDFAPFGSQQIPRTLVNDLPAHLLVHGQVTLLEPLRRSDYELLKAKEFTSPAQQIETTLVSRTTAESLIEVVPNPGLTTFPVNYTSPSTEQKVSLSGSSSDPFTGSNDATPATIYVRTDRLGRVQEAYSDSADHDPTKDAAAIARALTLQFKPLLINGVPHQMEAPLILPLRITIDPKTSH
jgi:hypothetical protein